MNSDFSSVNASQNIKKHNSFKELKEKTINLETPAKYSSKMEVKYTLFSDKQKVRNCEQTYTTRNDKESLSG